MRLKSRGALAVAASAIALSSCGGVQSSGPGHAAATPVSVRLSLAATTVDVATTSGTLPRTSAEASTSASAAPKKIRTGRIAR